MVGIITLKDLERGIERSHVVSALVYLIKHDKKTEEGVLYVYFKPNTRTLCDMGKQFGVKEIVRIAYLYSTGHNLSYEEGLSEEEISVIKSLPNPIPYYYEILLKSEKIGYKDEDFKNLRDESGEAEEESDTVTNKNITLKDIKREHVEKALDYILREPKEKNGIWYARGTPHKQKYVIEYDKEERFIGKKFGSRETFRLTFLYCAGIDVDSLKQSEFRKKFLEVMDNFALSKDFKRPDNNRKLEELGVKFMKEKEANMTNEMEDKAHDLLKQFYQIIFYGPPGTGKTYAAKNVIAELLHEDKEELPSLQGDQWDIVQFHPSYNYEDFVRGVKVTTKDNNVVYKTENRVFGSMCQRAQDNPNSKYVLIVDEINRANVSAVLGELIYALEYREEKIKTPYIVDGDADAMLIIPKNLYIIGTMNTADRTIGQIDYAVRRRFAFIPCLPDGSIVSAEAKGFFNSVDKIFYDHLSQDYDKDDVRIGHSYFMASGGKLTDKIIYQVVPILREYVKDGVLLSEAKDEIDEIEKEAKKLSSEDVEDKEQGESSQNRRFSWKNGERNSNGIIVGMRRTVLSIVKDFVEDYKGKNGRDITIEELREWFPDKAKHTKTRGIKLKEDIDTFNKDFFFMKEGDELKVDGKIAYVTKDWGDRGTHSPGELGSFHDFKEKIEEKGYKIDEIEKEAKILSSDEVENEGVDPIYEEEDTSSERDRYFWEKDGRHSSFLNKRKIVLSIVRDYVENNPDITVEELKAWFPDKAKHTKSRGIKLEEEIDFKSKGRFFMIEGLKVEGKVVYVTTQWGAERNYASGERGSFEDFREAIKKSGYLIRDENELEEEK